MGAKSLEKTFDIRNFLDDYQEKYEKSPDMVLTRANTTFIFRNMIQLNQFTCNNHHLKQEKQLHDLGQIVNPSPATEYSMSFGVIVGSTEKRISVNSS